MTTKIFYFTGSGNALDIARSIGSRLGDTTIVPIAKLMDGYSGGDEERIGLVFPAYAWGPPRIVADFVRKLKPNDSQYVFSVVTCGGTSGRTNLFLRQWLRANGSDLDAGFAVRGEVYAFLPGMGEPIIMKLVRWLARNDMAIDVRERLSEILETVAAKRDHAPETTNPSVDFISSKVHRIALRSFKTGDTSFAVGDACTSCSICARVCPRQNITLLDGRPVWHHDCEACFACLHWCPEEAITFNGEKAAEPKHHPRVTLKEVLLR